MVIIYGEGENDDAGSDNGNVHDGNEGDDVDD
jgi:hypothetical protein